RQLESLERGSFSELPDPVFVRGFIRAYCQQLGESPVEALCLYRQVMGERPASARASAAIPEGSAWISGPVFASLVLLVVFGLGLLATNFWQRREPSARVTGPMSAAMPVPAPVHEPPLAPAGGPADGAASQRLIVRAIEPTWLRIQSDDGRVAEELLAAGTTREWTAEKRFVLTIGNAGGVQIELNGRPMAPLGARGAVIRQLELPHAAATGS
ncbi:MAG TPA: RodZ domain-containing protein, partial [Candidatus Methylomirabilis sp.]|nr:RodZ domain-containing protein [Candidatus Methylomirabilis sp.]